MPKVDTSNKTVVALEDLKEVRAVLRKRYKEIDPSGKYQFRTYFRGRRERCYNPNWDTLKCDAYGAVIRIKKEKYSEATGNTYMDEIGYYIA